MRPVGNEWPDFRLSHIPQSLHRQTTGIDQKSLVQEHQHVEASRRDEVQVDERTICRDHQMTHQTASRNGTPEHHGPALLLLFLLDVVKGRRGHNVQIMKGSDFTKGGC